MMTDSAAIAAAERLKANASARVHRLGEPDELTEDTMPRKASTEPKPEPAEAPKKRGRKPGVKYSKKASAPASGPKFGVFDNGSVTLALPGCKGSMSPSEAREFLGFLKRIGVQA